MIPNDCALLKLCEIGVFACGEIGASLQHTVGESTIKSVTQFSNIITHYLPDIYIHFNKHRSQLLSHVYRIIKSTFIGSDSSRGRVVKASD